MSLKYIEKIRLCLNKILSDVDSWLIAIWFYGMLMLEKLPRNSRRLSVRPLRAPCEPPRLLACHFTLAREKRARLKLRKGVKHETYIDSYHNQIQEGDYTLALRKTGGFLC